MLPTTPCAACGQEMVSQMGWRRWPHVCQGMLRAAGRGLCHNCYATARNRGTLNQHPRITWARSELLDEWVLLRQAGCNIPQAASRLGVSVEALGKALQRARADGDERAVFSYAGMWPRQRTAPTETAGAERGGKRGAIPSPRAL